MTKPCIICVAITGSLPTKANNPAVPITVSLSFLILIGFGVSGLSDVQAGQGQLFTDPAAEKQRRLDRAFDAIRNRYGKGALKHGR